MTRGALLLLLLLPGCLTFEASLPGVLDLRAPLAAPATAELEPQRPALADAGDSFAQDWVLTETSAPGRGADAASYRRVLRQWYLLGLVPVATDPAVVSADLERALATPGARATQVQIVSGADLLDAGRTAAGCVCAPVVAPLLLHAVPTRTTEVTAVLVPAAAPSEGGEGNPLPGQRAPPTGPVPPVDPYLMPPPVDMGVPDMELPGLDEPDTEVPSLGVPDTATPDFDAPGEGG